MVVLVMAAGVVALVALAVLGVALLDAVDRAQRWEQEARLARGQRGRVALEVTLRDKRGLIAVHNLTAVGPIKYLRALGLAAGGRPFTFRQMAGVLTEDEWTGARDELVERGYLVHNGDRRAATWTEQGDVLLAEVRRYLSVSAGPAGDTAGDRRRVGEEEAWAGINTAG